MLTAMFMLIKMGRFLFKVDGKKIKTALRLPSSEVTYIRYILDSNFIPISGVTKKVGNSYKVKLTIAHKINN